MKLTILVDNNTLINRFFLAEPALSLFIESEDKKILFDVGYSDALIKNASAMGVDLLDLDNIVLSHGHLDHTWGIEPLIHLYTEAGLEKREHGRPEIIAHPDVFCSRTIGNIREIGTLISKEKISRQFKVNLFETPKWITDNLVFLGSIPRRNGFEGNYPIGKVIDGDEIKDDFIADDSALVYKTSNGLVVITGCSHSGICNIIEYAKEVCGVDRIRGVVGGFHLQNPNGEQLNKTLDYFKKLKPQNTYPCHCTDLRSKCALSSVVNVEEVGVGLQLEF